MADMFHQEDVLSDDEPMAEEGEGIKRMRSAIAASKGMSPNERKQLEREVVQAEAT